MNRQDCLCGKSDATYAKSYLLFLSLLAVKRYSMNGSIVYIAIESERSCFCQVYK